MSLHDRMKSFFLFGFLLLTLLIPELCAGADLAPAHFDVVIYGGTASGVMAAVAARSNGVTVALIEPSAHLGGMVSGGLSRTDVKLQKVIGGKAREFFERVGKQYNEPVTFNFEPHIAESVFDQWVKEAGVTLFKNERIESVKKDGVRIQSIQTNTKRVFEGGVFIDASYEGDLLALAGVSSTYGREARSVYNESMAGVQPKTLQHQFPLPLSAYKSEGVLYPLIKKETLGALGDGDKKLQAYTFRLCVSKNKANQTPFPKPDGYDSAQFTLLKLYLENSPDLSLDKLLLLFPLPNEKADVNNRGPVSTDYIGENWLYPEATYEQRQQIKKAHETYVKGLLYFLANDKSVPEAIQNELNQWGLARDEFVDNGNFPQQLYIREARRMNGAYVMVQSDVVFGKKFDDSIGMGSFNIDSHHVQRIVQFDGTVINEGDMQGSTRPYEIPYRSLLPKAAECENLIVPVCVSATHVAFGTLRMEPQFMIMGHAAGTAAASAIRSKVAVQAVDIPGLQSQLRTEGQILSLEEANDRYGEK